MGGCCGKKITKPIDKDAQTIVVEATDKPAQSVAEAASLALKANETLLKKELTSIGLKKTADDDLKIKNKTNSKATHGSTTSVADQARETKSTLSLASNLMSGTSVIDSKINGDDNSSVGSSVGESKIDSSLDMKTDSTIVSALGSNISITGSAISSTGSNLDIVPESNTGSRLDNVDSKLSSTGSKLDSSIGSTTGFNYEISASNLDSSLGSNTGTNESRTVSTRGSKLTSSKRSKTGSKMNRDDELLLSSNSKTSRTDSKVSNSSKKESKLESRASTGFSTTRPSTLSPKNSPKIKSKHSK